MEKISKVLRLAALVAIWLSGCSGKPSAEVRVDVIGSAPLGTMRVSQGVCGSLDRVEGSNISIATCEVSPGSRTFELKCLDTNLPTAILTIDVPEGTSHYVQFKNACSSSAKQIEAGNAASKTKWTWSPDG
jgi:hypothetical protein